MKFVRSLSPAFGWLLGDDDRTRIGKPSRPRPRETQKPRAAPRHGTRPAVASGGAKGGAGKHDRWWFDNEGTVITELDADGVPVGIRALQAQELGPQGVSPRFVILSLWGLVLALSLYGARDLRSMVLHDDELASRGAWVTAVEGWYHASQKLGLVRLRDALDSALSPIKQKTPSVDDRWAERSADEEPEAEQESERKRPEGSKLREAPPGAEPPAFGALALPQRPSPGADGAELRILLAGASSMQYYLGSELERRLETYQGVVTHRFGKLGTGLARPDNFDWPHQLERLLTSFRPHLMIGQFGGNDGQPLLLDDGGLLLFGSPEWDKEYTRRVQQIITSARKAGAGMVMLGMPVTRFPKLSERLKHVNEITQKATEAAGGVYFSTWDLAGGGNGEYRPSIDFDGKSGPMYLADGVHYARLGAAYVAQKLAWRLERYLQLTPRDESMAVAVRMELPSQARDKKTVYLAYVPQSAMRAQARQTAQASQGTQASQAPIEKLPVLYLLHGSGGSWTDFSDQAHELLQKAATKQGMVLITPDGDPEGWYVDSDWGKVDTYLSQELLPDVEARLPVSNVRGIAGISMGGNGAISMALRYPKTFASVSSMSGTVDLSEARSRPALIERLGAYEEHQKLWEGYSALQLVKAHPELARDTPIFLTVGLEDRWAQANRGLYQQLTQVGGDHLLKEKPGGHSWSHWLEVLPEHLAWHARLLHPEKSATVQ